MIDYIASFGVGMNYTLASGNQENRETSKSITSAGGKLVLKSVPQTKPISVGVGVSCFEAAGVCPEIEK